MYEGNVYMNKLKKNRKIFYWLNRKLNSKIDNKYLIDIVNY